VQGLPVICLKLTSTSILLNLLLLLVLVAYKIVCLLRPRVQNKQLQYSTRSYRLFIVEFRASVVVLAFLKMTSLR